MGWSQKISQPAYITHDFVLFSRFMIRWQKMCRNNFSPRFCAVFASDWLESLIHIHSTRGVSLISNCLLMSEGVSSGWAPILLLKEEDAWCWKDLTPGNKSFFLCQSKVSTAVAKHCNSFVQKITRVSNCCPSESTRRLIYLESLWASPHVETGQQSGILNFVFRLQYFKRGQFEWYFGQILCNS